MSVAKISEYVSKHWSVIAACVVFFAALWLSSKMLDYRMSLAEKALDKVDLRIDRVEERQAKNQEETNNSLQEIKLTVVEMKTMVREYLNQQQKHLP